MVERFVEYVLGIEGWLFAGLGLALLGMGITQILLVIRQQSYPERRWWLVPALIIGYALFILLIAVIRLSANANATIIWIVASVITVMVLTLRFLLSSPHKRVQPQRSPDVSGLGRTDQDIDREVQAILQITRNNKIEAIRRVRQLTGMDLKQAKAYVEARWLSENGQ